MLLCLPLLLFRPLFWRLGGGRLRSSASAAWRSRWRARFRGVPLENPPRGEELLGGPALSSKLPQAATGGSRIFSAGALGEQTEVDRDCPFFAAISGTSTLTAASRWISASHSLAFSWTPRSRSPSGHFAAAIRPFGVFYADEAPGSDNKNSIFLVFAVKTRVWG